MESPKKNTALANFGVTLKSGVFSRAAQMMQEATNLTDRARCDQCSTAQAFVVAGKEGLPDLFFCAHHYAKAEAALRNDGWSVLDQRFKLRQH